jgi:hypothetical protein
MAFGVALNGGDENCRKSTSDEIDTAIQFNSIQEADSGLCESRIQSALVDLKEHQIGKQYLDLLSYTHWKLQIRQWTETSSKNFYQELRPPVNNKLGTSLKTGISTLTSNKSIWLSPNPPAQ